MRMDALAAAIASSMAANASSPVRSQWKVAMTSVFIHRNVTQSRAMGKADLPKEEKCRMFPVSDASYVCYAKDFLAGWVRVLAREPLDRSCGRENGGPAFVGE